jgi:hypothetical protein
MLGRYADSAVSESLGKAVPAKIHAIFTALWKYSDIFDISTLVFIAARIGSF